MPKRGSGKRAAQNENPPNSDNDNIKKEEKDKEHDVIDKSDSKKRKTITQNFRMKIEHWYVDSGETCHSSNLTYIRISSSKNTTCFGSS